MREADLFVVGGGPAGAATAAAAGAAGLRVALAERARFPRRKLCGGFLAGEAHGVLSRLGAEESLLEAGAVRIDTVLVSTPAGRRFEATLPRPGGAPSLSVSRERLDLTLLEIAGRHAEVLHETEVVGLVEHRGRVRGVRVRRRSGEERERLARVVVAADGRRGTVARLLGRRPVRPPGPRAPVGLQVHLEGIASRVARRVELHFFRGGYLGLAALEDGLTNAALLAPRRQSRSVADPARLLCAIAAANPLAAARLEGARPSGGWSGSGPLGFGPVGTSLAGVLFVGDAAGTVDPFAGEGIAHGLRGGEALARLLVEAVRDGSPSTDAVSRAWHRTWRRLFRRQGLRCRLLGLGASHGWLLEPTVAACARSGPLAAGLVGATRPRPPA